MPYTIIISDDHEVARAGIVSLISKDDNYKIIGEVGTADETIEICLNKKPDILILDLGLPDKSGLEVLYALSDKNFTGKYMVLTAQTQDLLCKQALLAGAHAYLLKDSSSEVLLTTLRNITFGSIHVPEKYVHLLKEVEEINNDRAKTTNLGDLDPLNKLSKREREIFYLIANGLPNRAIAKKLFISPRTVETHRSRVIKKMGFDSSAGLIRFAVQNNLLN